MERLRGSAREGLTVRNLELKARCQDEVALEELIVRARAGGAVHTRTMAQRDTYFAAPHGRLKLREWWTEAADGDTAARREPAATGEDGEAGTAGAVLIAYARPNTAGSRYSDYLLSPVADPSSLAAALARALDSLVVVEKRRVLYHYGRTRIHFDRVARLGAFVELETVLEPPGAASLDEDVAAAEHRAVIALLGLDRLPVVAGSYSDLLAGRGGD